MLLVIDLGNTNIVLGIYSREKLVHHFRITTPENLSIDECGLLVKHLLAEAKINWRKIKDVVLSSVVPRLTSVFERMVFQYLQKKPLIVGAHLKTGLKIMYDNPTQVGADRIANAVAGFEIYGGPLIIVDLGTATTFDVISKNAEYLGGVIAPGLLTASQELFRRAAKLYQIELSPPTKIIGTNTEESLRTGIILGTIGQIDGIVKRIWQELGEETRVIATGGLAYLVANDSETIEKVDRFLTLEGLRRIHLKNKSNIKNQISK
ncbi:MAG: type III pantothenate kinase [Candidatus Edwardsbacteria bacterium]